MLYRLVEDRFFERFSEVYLFFSSAIISAPYNAYQKKKKMLPIMSFSIFLFCFKAHTEVQFVFCMVQKKNEFNIVSLNLSIYLLFCSHLYNFSY